MSKRDRATKSYLEGQHSHGGSEHGHEHTPKAEAATASATYGAQQSPGDDVASILRPVPGIQIIDDVTAQFGVDTLEGRIGPLLRGVVGRAHFIEMPAGLYLYEHPHPTEAIIYTVRGEWVLCTEGRRHLMHEGSLFWFGPDIAAGYEVPFEKPAFILIFKSEGSAESPQAFVDYLGNKLAPDLLQEQANGARFRVRELPLDHPARVYARSQSGASD